MGDLYVLPIRRDYLGGDTASSGNRHCFQSGASGRAAGADQSASPPKEIMDDKLMGILC